MAGGTIRRSQPYWDEFVMPPVWSCMYICGVSMDPPPPPFVVALQYTALHPERQVSQCFCPWVQVVSKAHPSQVIQNL